MKKFLVEESEKKKLLLEEKRDYQILEKIYQLQKRKLNKEQKELVNFLKTQLENDWRAPLIKYLNKLLKKFKH